MAIAEELKLIVTAQTDKAVRSMQQFRGTVEKSQTGIQKMLGSWKNLIVGFGAAYLGIQGVRKLLTEAFEAAQYAAKFQQIEIAFTTMVTRVGENADKVVADMKAMSQGAISEMDLIAAASKAMLFDIPADQLATLMQIATASATATGESVKYMFDSIVTGIARGSPLILDNLGLTLKIGDAVNAYAAALGKSADELTAEERKQATLNATLEAGTKLVDKLGDSVTQLTAQRQYEVMQANFENLRKEVGTFMLPAFQSITKTASEFAAKLTEIVELRNIMRAVKEGTASAEDRVKLLNDQIEKMQDTMKRGANINIMGAGFGDTAKLDALIKQRDNLILQQAKLAEMENASTAAAKAQAQAEAAAAAAEAARAARLAEYLALVEDAYNQTEKGQREALESAIAYWEEQLPHAVATHDKVITILANLREELESMDAPLQQYIDIWDGLPEVQEEVNAGLLDTAKNAGQLSMEFFGLNDMASQYLDTLGEIQALTEEDVTNYENQQAAIKNVGDAMERLGALKRDYIIVLQALKPEIEDTTAILAQLGAVGQRAFADIFAAFGETLANAEEGWASLADAAKGAVSSILRALGQYALGKAATAFGEMLDAIAQVASGNVLAAPGIGAWAASAAKWGAAAALAFAGSGAVKAMAEGGVVTKPTLAMVGERGPEAVIPLSRAGGRLGATVNVYVTGSVIEESNLVRAISRAQQKAYLSGY